MFQLNGFFNFKIASVPKILIDKSSSGTPSDFQVSPSLQWKEKRNQNVLSELGG